MLLSEPAVLGNNVQTVCLPPQGLSFEGRCFSSGWGKSDSGHNTQRKDFLQTIMKKIDLPIVPRQSCEKKLRSTRLGHYFNLHKSFICAGGELDKNTFVGDGGAPLVCPIPFRHEQYFLAGAVAWGIITDDTIPGKLVLPYYDGSQSYLRIIFHFRRIRECGPIQKLDRSEIQMQKSSLCLLRLPTWIVDWRAVIPFCYIEL